MIKKCVPLLSFGNCVLLCIPDCPEIYDHSSKVWDYRGAPP